MNKFQMKNHKKEKKYVNKIDNSEIDIKDYINCIQNLFYVINFQQT